MPLSPTDIALVAAGALLNPDITREEVAKHQAKDRVTIVWHLRNLEDGSEIEGQFPAEDPVLNLSNAYGQHVTLNRENPIIQYLHGDADTFSFVARFYAMHGDDNNPTKQIRELMSWRQRDPNLARPPRVAFTFGNVIPFPEAVITGLSNIVYSEPKPDGDVREVSVRVDLLRYKKYSIDTDPEPETRYHRARTGDYYELLTWYEYRDPMLGDIVRREHPDKTALTEGDIVKMPSYGALRGSIVKPASIPLFKAYTSKDTATRRLRIEAFEEHDKDYVSAVIPEGL